MKTNLNTLFIILLVFVSIISFTTASLGDQSVYYLRCLNEGYKENCTTEGEFKTKVLTELDIFTKLLWTCVDECKYNCMWAAVRGFQEKGNPIPKFHGKWPFKRIFGIQEPASAFASILNLISHLYMQIKISQKIPVRTRPVVFLWHIFILVMLNGWFWSTIFHTRDTPFTEFMDYACALSMIKALYLAGVIRIFGRKRKLTALILLLSMPFYFRHVVYLYSGRINYEFNMLVNGFFAVTGLIMWLAWAAFQYLGGKHYTWRLIAFTILSALSLSLEIFDFPPKWGWDAHALWHLSTAPLPILFYRFVMDDLQINQNQFELSMYIQIPEINKSHKLS